jgi:DNA polymerase (family 10)
MTNIEIAELLRNISACYQLKDPIKYKFQIIAYDRAATAVEHSTSELKDLWDDGKLDDVPGIGQSIASHLDEVLKNGKSKHFEELMKGIPKEAFKLMELPKIGIKTAIKLINEKSKSEIKDLIKIVDISRKNKRHLLPYAQKIASEVTEWILKCPEVEKIDSLGSLRRMAATVGDIDISVASKNSLKVIDQFVKFPKIQEIIEKGDHTASILIPGNIQVDLMVTKPSSYGSLLQHFTGSKFHNIALREHAQKLGFSLSEYGVKKVNSKNNKILEFETEEKLYNFLKIDYIEPELRENMGELEASESHNLPKLIKLKDIKGDLQIHSDFDIETNHDLGLSSMEDIAKKAIKLNYEYIAFTEHNPSISKHTDKEIVEILKRKSERVDQLNYSISNNDNNRVFKVFNSLEIDINKDGSLPISNEGLETLDFSLVSVHSSFDLSKDEMTRRVLNSLNHSKIKILAHPTARKINDREGIELDWSKIFEFCIKNNKFLEINADPARLDLPDSLVREAVKHGVKMTLGTDSHDVVMLDNMIYGVSVARRGWCETKNIVNCLSLEKFKEVIKL